MGRARHILIPACVLLLGATLAVAGDPARVERSRYRLAVDDRTSFRLQRMGAEHISRQVPEKLAGKPYATQIQRVARQSAVDPALVHAVIAVESGYDPSARSPKGALGLMQVMPQTARRYGVSDPARSAEINLRVGTRYLSDLIALFDGRLDLALAAYNAGEQAVLRHGTRIPPYRETQRYVEAVSNAYRSLRRSGSTDAMTRRAYLRGTRLEAQARHAYVRVTTAR
jgi:soluble lytic murein transglycosylase-like protein